MTIIERWCRAVEGDDDSFEGKLTLSNLIHDLDSNHVETHLISRLLREIRAAFPRWSKEALYLITHIADSAAGEFFCRGQIAPRRDASCSRVVLDCEFMNGNVDRKKLGWLIEGARVPDEQLNRVMKDPSAFACRHFPLRRSKHGFAWVTESASLERVVDAEKRAKRPPADRVRNKLGLAHFLANGQHRLLEIRYPPRFFVTRRKVRFAAPTFLESRPPNMVFRSQRTPDGWGVTVDLDNGHPGLPEAVHGRIRFTGRGFQIENLGRFDRVTSGYSYRTLYETAPTPWTPARRSDLEALSDD